jgi:hypothetical protein
MMLRIEHIQIFFTNRQHRGYSLHADDKDLQAKFLHH